MSRYLEFFKILKIILRQSRERWYVFSAFIFRSIFYGIEMILPLLLGFVVDRLIPTKDIVGLQIWLIATILLMILSLAYLALVVNYLFARFDMNTAAKMQTMLMSNLFGMKNYNYEKHSDGKLINITQNDYAEAVSMVYQFVTGGLISIISLSAMLIVIYHFSFSVFIVAICSLPFYVGLMFVNDKKVQFYQKLRLEAIDKRQSIRKYVIEHMKQINSNSMSSMYEKFNNESILDTVKINLTFLFWYFLSITLPNLVPKTTKYIAIFIGAVGVINGQITLGVMLILTAYMENIIAPMRDICQTVVKISSSKRIFERLLEFLDKKDEVDSYDNFLLPSTSDMFIDMKNVVISNPSGDNLFKINKLTLGSNGIIQLSGLNGTGKTTFINLLTNASHSNGFRILEGGHVRLSEQFAKNPAIFSMPFVFFPGTVRTNILLDKEPPSNFCEIIEILDVDFLDKEINPFSLDLSLGERTKITLARIFLQDKKIIVLDEPFANLDIETTSRTVDYLKKIAKEHLIIAVTHDEALSKVRTSILEITDGLLIES